MCFLISIFLCFALVPKLVPRTMDFHWYWYRILKFWYRDNPTPGHTVNVVLFTQLLLCICDFTLVIVLLKKKNFCQARGILQSSSGFPLGFACIELHFLPSTLRSLPGIPTAWCCHHCASLWGWCVSDLQCLAYAKYAAYSNGQTSQFWSHKTTEPSSNWLQSLSHAVLRHFSLIVDLSLTFSH